MMHNKSKVFRDRTVQEVRGVGPVIFLTQSCHICHVGLGSNLTAFVPARHSTFLRRNTYLRDMATLDAVHQQLFRKRFLNLTFFFMFQELPCICNICTCPIKHHCPAEHHERHYDSGLDSTNHHDYPAHLITPDAGQPFEYPATLPFNGSTTMHDHYPAHQVSPPAGRAPYNPAQGPSLEKETTNRFSLKVVF